MPPDYRDSAGLEVREHEDSASLEVREYRDNDGLEVVPGDGLVVADHHAGAGLEPVRFSNGKYSPDHPLQSDEKYTLDKAINTGNPHPDYLRRRRRRALCGLGAIVLCLVVLAAVVGGVLGSRARSASAVSQDPSASPASPNASASPASEHNTTRALLANTSLAAVAWAASDGVQYRVFYQDQSLQIRMSSWDNVHMTWTASNTSIGHARNGTPLAAAVLPSPDASVINLFAIDDSGHINEWVLTNTAGNDWQTGTLNSHDIIPANASKISATWTMTNGQAVCTVNCMSLLLLYQDDKDQFQLCNATSKAWNFSSVNANPIAGSGVSLTTVIEAKYPAQLRLFYQIGSGSLVAADWVSGAQLAGENVTGTNSGWNLNENIPLATSTGPAPLTSFAWGFAAWAQSYGIMQGSFPWLLDVLISGPAGISEATWFTNYTSTFRYASKSPAFNIIRSSSAVASHAWGSLYALQNGSLEEFAFDANYAWFHRNSVPTS